MEKTPLGNLELNVVFKSMRILALFVVLFSIYIAMNSLIDGIPDSGKIVTFDDVGKIVNSKGGDEDTTESNAVSLTYHANINDFFTGDNKKVLDDWISIIDADNRQTFIDGLSNVLKATKDKKIDNTSDYINEYKTLQMKEFSKNETWSESFSLVEKAVFIGAFMLCCLASLVLLMGRIEKNTRKPTTEAT